MSAEFVYGDQTAEMDLDPSTIPYLKVPDLKRELKIRGLTVSGKKEELVERLQLAVMPAGGDDDDEDLLAEASALLEDEPLSAKLQVGNKIGQPKKKVAIKRDTNLPAVSDNKTTPVSGGAVSQIKTAETLMSATKSPNLTEKGKPKITWPGANGSISSSDGMKKAVTTAIGEPDKSVESKPTVMSDAEKVKSRAERFGTSVSDIEEKKASRAARFGISNSSQKIGASPGVDLETLKRRAERFGQTTSKAMQKLELQDKIKEREQRFGKVDAPSKDSKRARITAPNQDLMVDEKMKKRAERFGAVA